MRIASAFTISGGRTGAAYVNGGDPARVPPAHTEPDRARPGGRRRRARCTPVNDVSRRRTRRRDETYAPTPSPVRSDRNWPIAGMTAVPRHPGPAPSGDPRRRGRCGGHGRRSRRRAARPSPGPAPPRPCAAGPPGDDRQVDRLSPMQDRDRPARHRSALDAEPVPRAHAGAVRQRGPDRGGLRVAVAGTGRRRRAATASRSAAASRSRR